MSSRPDSKPGAAFLPSLASLSLEPIDAKAGKETTAPSKPYDKSAKASAAKAPAPKNAPTHLKEFDFDDWDPPTYKGQVVRTVKLHIKNSTEIEKAWLRSNYGNYWSLAAKSLRSQLQEQARRALSF